MSSTRLLLGLVLLNFGGCWFGHLGISTRNCEARDDFALVVAAFSQRQRAKRPTRLSPLSMIHLQYDPMRALQNAAAAAAAQQADAAVQQEQRPDEQFASPPPPPPPEEEQQHYNQQQQPHQQQHQPLPSMPQPSNRGVYQIKSEEQY